VLTFVKSEVKEIRAVGLPILSGKVDIANVRIEFESGCVANFTASRVSTERVRKLRFFSRDNIFRSIMDGRMCWCFRWEASAAAQKRDEIPTAQPSVNPQIADG
jgi:hypothetical protein